MPSEENRSRGRDDAERLRWQCRRGMLELDVLLTRFMDQGYGELDAADRARFSDLLDFEDQLLLDWFMGYAVPADPGIGRLVARIRG
jgi:antitoxin CptB